MVNMVNIILVQYQRVSIITEFVMYTLTLQNLMTHFVIVLRSVSVIPEVLDPTTQSDRVSHMM